MGLKSFFNSLIENIEVTSKEGYLYIEGVSPDVIQRDIRRIMNKSDVASLFIKVVGWKIIRIPEFFILEFYILLTLILNNRKSLCNVRTITKLIDVLKTRTWLADTKKHFPSKIDFKLQDDFNVKLFKFQSDFLEKYDQTTQRYHLNGMLLAGAAGSGKTLTSLVTMHCLKCDKIIIVCPKNAVYKVWEDNICKFFKKPQTYWIVADGRPYKDERFIIVHYEAMEKVLAIIDDIRIGNEFGIILDESHNLNEIKTNRAQAFIKLCKSVRCKNVIFASGTPIKALAVETLPLFTVMDNFFNENVAMIFKKLYAKNLDVIKNLIRRRLNEVVYKIEKSQLGLDEPVFNTLQIKLENGLEYTLDAIKEKIKAYVTEKSTEYKKNMDDYLKKFNDIVDETEEKLAKKDKKISEKFQKYREDVDTIREAHDHRKLHEHKDMMASCNKFEREMIISNIDNGDKIKEFTELKTLVKYYTLKIQGDVLGKIILQARVNATKEIAKKVNYKLVINSSYKKTVIFTSYIEAAEAAINTLKEKNYKPLGVYGKYTNDLKSIVTQFEAVSELNPLVATYSSLATAVPLVVADTMLILNPPYRDYQLNQAISRIHRLGSDTQVCINICTLDTGNLPNITTRTVDILKWSQEEIEKITGTPCAYAIGDVLTYKDIDAMQAPIHTGVSELALKTDPLADKFTRFIKRIRPMSNVRRWKYGNS